MCPRRCCGSGATLLKNGHRFASGLGIDDDPARIGLAEEALRRKGRSNVELRLLDFLEDGHELEPESFDFVFSERGPIGYDSYGIQAALRVLMDDGLLFREMIGNLHHQEVAGIFGPSLPLNQMIRTMGQALGCNGAQLSRAERNQAVWRSKSVPLGLRCSAKMSAYDGCRREPLVAAKLVESRRQGNRRLSAWWRLACSA